MNRVFVSSVIDKDFKWVYYETLLFLKTFRKIYPSSELFMYYSGKNIKIRLLLKKYEVIIINKLKIENNYYAIKPAMCYYVSKKYKPNYITWIDIDSVFYKKSKPQNEILKHPVNEYTKNNDKMIILTSKILGGKVKKHCSSAIFTLHSKIINKYFINFKNYSKKLIKNKGIYNIINKNISIKFLEETLEEFSFNVSITGLNLKYNNHLEYFGTKIRKNISCHDHYHISRINPKYLITNALKTNEYKYYRIKENAG
jgi:hypothetical protein